MPTQPGRRGSTNNSTLLFLAPPDGNELWKDLYLLWHDLAFPVIASLLTTIPIIMFYLQYTTAICPGLVVLFIFVFSAALSFTLIVRRTENFAAPAAFVALQAVFVGIVLLNHSHQEGARR